MSLQTTDGRELSNSSTWADAPGARVAESTQLVRGEYLEIPRLQLTRNQVQRLWALDDVTCDAVVKSLVDARFLKRTSGDAYVRADDGAS